MFRNVVSVRHFFANTDAAISPFTDAVPHATRGVCHAQKCSEHGEVRRQVPVRAETCFIFGWRRGALIGTILGMH